MPVSSIVIGVDLFPIRPVTGCIALIEDITTDKCKASLTKELQNWKADVVLHDGAPNVGKNWLFDAYQQICLTLSAVKLSTEFLKKGGWFVTKVFRSKDYNALIWVLKQLFRKVHATKPSASRKESAEIFVVCQYYIAPDKIDPKLLNAKYVFEELDLDTDKEISLLHPDKKRIKAEGYSEKDFLLRQELPVSQFIKETNGLSSLQGVSEIIFDDDTIKNHPRTTNEIRECCRDIKVLGRKDIRALLTWWKHLRAEFYPKIDPTKTDATAESTADEKPKQLTADEVETMEFEELEKHLNEMAVEDAKDDKRKKKKVLRARTKLNEKLNLKMVIKGDSGPQEEDIEIFSLGQIGTVEELERLQDQPPDIVINEKTRSDEYNPKYKRFDKDEFHLDKDGKYKSDKHKDDENNKNVKMDSDDEDLSKTGLGLSSEEDEDDDDDDDEHLGNITKNKKNKQKIEHPLITDLDHRDKDSKRKQRVQLWFEKENLKNVDADEMAEDFDLDKLTNEYKYKGINITGKDKVDASSPSMPLGKKAKRRAKYTNEEHKSESDDSDSDSVDSNEDFKSVPIEKQKRIKLNEQELALGAMMVQSRKTKRDLIDSAWNRYAFNDIDDLPEWFVQDESVHMKREAPVTKELVDEYAKRVEELNVRPMKKVMEAKARKKRRAVKRLEKAKKKAENILESADSSAQEKMRQLKKYVLF